MSFFDTEKLKEAVDTLNLLRKDAYYVENSMDSETFIKKTSPLVQLGQVFIKTEGKMPSKAPDKDDDLTGDLANLQELVMEIRNRTIDECLLAHIKMTQEIQEKHVRDIEELKRKIFELENPESDPDPVTPDDIISDEEFEEEMNRQV